MTRRVKRFGMAACMALIAWGGVSHAAGEGWLTDFEKAKKLAAEKERPILVDFTGSDWCGWCIKLDKEVFSQDEFKKYAKDNLVLFVADFPRRKELPDDVKEQNKKLASKFGVTGLPTIMLLDKNGEKLQQTGYKRGGAEAYVEHLKELLAKK